ncbi:MAG: disulfide bond formation protein B [Methylotenera sp.]|nr:disulfide bond formation protein B [Methylotenera sp.]MDO9233405.1 disulfide bond formation protein B [Methylotenera sp.]MDO9388648.1 disulfide bond formation protein B [Methylotenera sp.]MDP2101858.1 disulfide bond formation protein B [Methylotenera sp.]MDP2280806.1 disulfide bond formation protein B [Methylotenera sp.]
MLNKLITGRTGYFIGFIACFGLVGLALWIQTRYNLEPCPLCISQRIMFMALGVLFLLAAIFKQTPKFFAALQVVAALGGAGVAIRHWWIQAHRESMIADCGVGFDYMFENFPLEKALKLVFKGTGDCAAIDWTFLGLTIPQMSLIAFVGFGIYAVYLARLNLKNK